MVNVCYSSVFQKCQIPLTFFFFLFPFLTLGASLNTPPQRMSNSCSFIIYNPLLYNGVQWYDIKDWNTWLPNLLPYHWTPLIAFFPLLDGKVERDWFGRSSTRWDKTLLKYFPLENRPSLWKTFWAYFAIFIFSFLCQSQKEIFLDLYCGNPLGFLDRNPTRM